MSERLEKAYIELRKPPATPDGPLGGSVGEVKFQFNPDTYVVKKSAKWEYAPVPETDQTTMPQYVGPQASDMTIKVFLDARESTAGHIDKDVETLLKCCTPLAETVEKKAPSPPFVIFGWGKKLSFTAFVKQVEVTYTMFDTDGTPLRADCSLTLQEIPSKTAGQNPTSGSTEARRTRTVVTGDSLASLAYQEYGQAKHWRAIAEANRIDDPSELPSGTRLLIPPGPSSTAERIP